MTNGSREEVLNVELARFLLRRGVASAPEQVLNRRGVGRRLPDVLIDYQGLRTIIEGKVDDSAGAKQQCLGDAERRVSEGLAHIALAVVYPAALRGAAFANLQEELEAASVEIAICTENGTDGFAICRTDELPALLIRTFEYLVREDVVERAVTSLEAGVDVISAAIMRFPSVVDRSAEILGIPGGKAPAG